VTLALYIESTASFQMEGAVVGIEVLGYLT
jgi:hypothetical protein